MGLFESLFGKSSSKPKEKEIQETREKQAIDPMIDSTQTASTRLNISGTEEGNLNPALQELKERAEKLEAQKRADTRKRLGLDEKILEENGIEIDAAQPEQEEASSTGLTEEDIKLGITKEEKDVAGQVLREIDVDKYSDDENDISKLIKEVKEAEGEDLIANITPGKIPQPNPEKLSE